MEMGKTGTGHQEPGQTAKLIFLPHRYYRPKTEWTDEDWTEAWTEHVRHRRSVKNCRTWEEGRDHVLGMQDSWEENMENQDRSGGILGRILFSGLCFLVVLWLLALNSK
jgi:hypothetical protein